MCVKRILRPGEKGTHFGGTKAEATVVGGDRELGKGKGESGKVSFLKSLCEKWRVSRKGS